MLEINKIYCGDCLRLMKEIPDESIDLIVTDPPYNVSHKDKIGNIHRKGRKSDIRRDFGEWDYNFDIVPFLSESKRVLNDFGSIIVWTSENLYPKYRLWFEEYMYPEQLLIWVKTNPVPQFRLIRYRQATELMFWASKNKNTKKNPNFLFLNQKEMTNVFYAPIVGGKERTKHPTQKPLKITKEIIIRHCREGGIVLDPFLGSGTTALAALQLNRNYIGIEISQEYVDIANKRIDDYKQQLKLI